MDDHLTISHVENECAPLTISLLQSGTFYVVINDIEAAFNKLLDKAYTLWLQKPRHVTDE